MYVTRLSTLLVWAVTGTYLLIALGATAAATASGPLLLIHYATATAIGLVCVIATVIIWSRSAPTSVRWLLTAATIVYPIQALLGLSIAADWTLADGRLHLLGGVGVFTALLIGLVRQLEHESSGSTEHAAADDPTAGSTTASSTTGASSASPATDPPPTPPTIGTSSTPPVTDSGAIGSAPSESTEERRTASLSNAHEPASRRAKDGGSWIDEVRRTVGAYVTLTKPRLMWLLCLLALAGMGLAVAVGGSVDGLTVVATLAGGVLAVGASGTFNHVYERDRDRLMDRTADRPVVTGGVTPRRATLFGLGLTVASVTVLVTLVNVLSALLTVAAIVYYAVVYTVVLKPTTRWNTVIGGGSGALPAVIGYAAVVNTVDLPAVLLAAVVCCWTPAHFYNFAIVHREQYARASYPMLPVVEGVTVTRRRIFGWLGMTLLAAVWLGSVAGFGTLYAFTTAIVGGLFAWTVAVQYRHDTAGAIYRSFYASNAYLACLLAAVLIETVVIG